MLKNICPKLKYLVYLLIYLVITFIAAYFIFSISLPDDGQCHCDEMPKLAHYIFAAIITAAPVITAIVLKNRKPKSDKNKL